MITEIITYIGLALIGLGALADLIASIGMHRFKTSTYVSTLLLLEPSGAQFSQS